MGPKIPWIHHHLWYCNLRWRCWKCGTVCSSENDIWRNWHTLILPVIYSWHPSRHERKGYIGEPLWHHGLYIGSSRPQASRGRHTSFIFHQKKIISLIQYDWKKKHQLNRDLRLNRIQKIRQRKRWGWGKKKVKKKEVKEEKRRHVKTDEWDSGTVCICIFFSSSRTVEEIDAERSVGKLHGYIFKWWRQNSKICT